MKMYAGAIVRDHGIQITYLIKNVLKDTRVKYIHDPSDLKIWFTYYLTKGKKHIKNRCLLELLLDRFGICTRRDEVYRPHSGEFLSLPEVSKVLGFATNYGIPFDRVVKLSKNDIIHATFLSVIYQNREKIENSLKAHYVVYTVNDEFFAICFGRE